MQFVHLSDTHLGYMQYGLEDREQDFYEAFNEIIDRILSEHIRIVIHSGDFFHTPRPPIRALKIAQDGLLRLHERGVHVIIVPGGHDTLRRRGLPPLSLYERFGIKVLSRSNFYTKIGNLCIIGLQHYPKIYWSNPELRKYLDKYSSFVENNDCAKRILVMHQGLYPYMKYGYELTIDQLPKNFDYYALGHLHKRIKVSYGRGILAYSGSTEIVEMSEIEEYKKNGKGFYIVDLSGDVPDVQNVNLSCIRPQYEIEWESVKLEDLLLAIKDILEKETFAKKPILHIRVYNRLIDRLTIEKMFGTRFKNNFLKIRIVTSLEEKSVSETLILDRERLDLENILLNRFKNNELVSFINVILSSLKENDVKSAINISKKVFDEGSWKRWIDAFKEVET